MCPCLERTCSITYAEWRDACVDPWSTPALRGETDGPCEVEVLGCSTQTFRIGDHHYALLHVTGLDPGGLHEYEVRLDGEKVWPEAGSSFPPSVIRPLKNGKVVKLTFGSCRISAPHEPPYTLDHDEDERGLGVDALYATAMRLKDEPPEELPHALELSSRPRRHPPPNDGLPRRQGTGRGPPLHGRR